tara:strand:+ start:32 stop:472 length:441 start_codon:yes stop_codon:yes gene_type:complete
MSTLNINDLYDSINNKNFKRLKKFDDILLQIHRRIKYHADLEQTYCSYSIPEFIFGTPLYNINDLKNYIMNTLKKNGFKLVYFHPNTLLISWDVENKLKNKDDKKKKNNNKNQQFRLIDDYNPQGNFVYNETSLLNMRDKTKNLLQ